MSDNIPFEIQEEIMKSAPVKSLLQWRSVSKAWKSLIDSSQFIAAHALRHTQRRCLFVSYIVAGGKRRYVSFIDDDTDTFPKENFALTVPMTVDLLHNVVIVGTSFGLFCLLGQGDMAAAVVWNPSIRKSVVIPMPNGRSLSDFLGFGVCPDTLEPKIIIKFDHVNTDVYWKVEVYALNSGKWTSLESSNLPFTSIVIPTTDQVVIGRFIYWEAFNSVSRNTLIPTTIDRFIIHVI